jgi:hypothetical protein
MPASHSAVPSGFGAAFNVMLAASGLTVDGVLRALPEDRRGQVSRSTLYDWKKGQHLPLDASGALLEVVRVCLDAADKRGAALGVSPASEDGWRRLLAEAKQARDADIARDRHARGGEPGSAWHGRPLGGRDPVSPRMRRAIGDGARCQAGRCSSVGRTSWPCRHGTGLMNLTNCQAGTGCQSAHQRRRLNVPVPCCQSASRSARSAANLVASAAPMRW